MGKDMLDLEADSWRRNTVVKAVMKQKLKQLTITSPNVEAFRIQVH